MIYVQKKFGRTESFIWIQTGAIRWECVSNDLLLLFLFLNWVVFCWHFALPCNHEELKNFVWSPSTTCQLIYTTLWMKRIIFERNVWHSYGRRKKRQRWNIRKFSWPMNTMFHIVINVKSFPELIHNKYGRYADHRNIAVIIPKRNGKNDSLILINSNWILVKFLNYSQKRLCKLEALLSEWNHNNK